MTLDWLMDNAGPIIRWRAGNELMPGISDTERNSLARELIAAPLVREWLSRLTLGEFSTPLDSLDVPSLGKLGGMVHGAKAACLENVLGKLSEFGLKAGMTELDERLLPLRLIFRWKANWKSDTTFQNAWETLVKSVFAWGLLRMGYTPDEPMKEFLLSHLQTCHKIARGRQSSWVQESLRFLESFCSTDGHYHLPSKYLRESEGYYVSGYGMGLGESRRKSTGIEVESTFRMLKIGKDMDLT